MLAVSEAEGPPALHPPHDLVGRQRAARERRRRPPPVHAEPGHGVGQHGEHLPRPVEAAEERLLEQLEIPVVPARQLALEMEHGGEVSLHERRARAGQLEEVGVPLVRHDAGAGREPRRHDDKAELLAAQEHDVLRQLPRLVAQLRAPEQHRGLELPPAVLHRADGVLGTGEAECPGRRFAPERQRHAVPGRAAERRAIHRRPDRGQRLSGVDEPLGKGERPEPGR